MTRCIVYKGGYTYLLKREHVEDIELKPDKDIVTDFIGLGLNGRLVIKPGYAWDGPSGPTFDTKTFMRGSLVHDALYQLIREGFLDLATHRPLADAVLKRMCLEDGMASFRAWYVHAFVRRFGKPATDPDRSRPLTCAPKDCTPPPDGHCDA